MNKIEKIDMTKISEEYKNIFCILLAEKAKEYLKDCEEYGAIVKTLNKCWEWVRDKCEVADDLFEAVESEEETCFVAIQCMETNFKKIQAWSCIIDAVYYVSKSAYIKEGYIYFPQSLESVHEDGLQCVIHYLLDCDSENQRYIMKV